jgi:hypothetical protein
MDMGDDMGDDMGGEEPAMEMGDEEVMEEGGVSDQPPEEGEEEEEYVPAGLTRKAKGKAPEQEPKSGRGRDAAARMRQRSRMEEGEVQKKAPAKVDGSHADHKYKPAGLSRPAQGKAPEKAPSAGKGREASQRMRARHKMEEGEEMEEGAAHKGVAPTDSGERQHRDRDLPSGKKKASQRGASKRLGLREEDAFIEEITRRVAARLLEASKK